MNLDMICTCGIDGVREVEARRLRILQRMNLPQMSDLATAIALSLAFDFECDAWILADQWFGVSIETPLVPEGIGVECDHPADGLAAIWEVLADKYPERVSIECCRSIIEETIPSRERAVDVSNTLLAIYEKAQRISEEHRAVHDYDHGCDVCRSNMDLRVNAHVALDEAWGAKDLEPVIAAAYGE